LHALSIADASDFSPGQAIYGSGFFGKVFSVGESLGWHAESAIFHQN